MARAKIASKIDPGICRLVTGLLAGLTCVLLAAAAAMLALLMGLAFQNELTPQVRKTASIIAHSASERFSQGLALNVPLEQIEGVDDFFEELVVRSPARSYFALTDLNGRVLHRGGEDEAIHHSAQEIMTQPLGVLSNLGRQGDALPEKAIFADTIGGFYHVVVPIAHQGVVAGGLHVAVPVDLLEGSLANLTPDLITIIAVAVFVACVLLIFNLIVRTTGRLGLLHASVERVASAGDFNGYFRSKIKDEIGRFARIYNQIISRLNERYANLRQDVRETRAAQISSETISDIDGAVLKLRKSFAFGGAVQGHQQQLRERQFIHLPLLLFLFAEELSRAFLPLYAQQLYQFDDPIGSGLAIALPIVAFMFSVMVVTPLASVWQDQIVIRKLGLLGLCPALAGYLGTAVLASDLIGLIGWRCLSALGYGLIYCAAQGFLLRQDTHKSVGGRGLREFSSAFFLAAVAAPAAGAILAELVGYQNTFWISSALVFVAAWLIYIGLENDRLPERRQRTTWRKISSALKVSLFDRRLCVLLLFASIPQRMLITGVWFYAMPLYLFSLGYDVSRIGQVFLGFGLVALLVYLVSARVIRSMDRTDGLVSERAVLVCAGSLISGAGGIMIFLAAGDLWLLLLAVAMLALGRGMGVTPQSDLALDLAAARKSAPLPNAVLAVNHAIGRVGSVLGPLVILAFIVSEMDVGSVISLGLTDVTPSVYANAIAAMGIVVVAGGLLFAIFGLIGARRPSTRVTPTLKKRSPTADQGAALRVG